MGFGTGLPRVMPNLTWQCAPQIENVMRRQAAGAKILDLGAGGRRIAPHVTTVDFVKLPDTDLVSDVTDIPLSSGSVDLIVATGLLEHVADEQKFLREVHRLLKPGGELHIEVPFLQQHHDDPIDCRRYTLPGLALFLEQQGFEALESGVHIGPSVTIATLNAYYIALLFEGDGIFAKALSNAAFFIVAWLGAPLKYLDRFLLRKKSAHRLAFGVYCTARKRA